MEAADSLGRKGIDDLRNGARSGNVRPGRLGFLNPVISNCRQRWICLDRRIGGAGFFPGRGKLHRPDALLGHLDPQVTPLFAVERQEDEERGPVLLLGVNDIVTLGKLCREVSLLVCGYRDPVVGLPVHDENYQRRDRLALGVLSVAAQGGCFANERDPGKQGE